MADTTAGNVTYTLRCKTTEERDELKVAIEGLVKSRGAGSAGEVVPDLVNLISEEVVDVPESITSHVHAVGASLDVIRSEVQAIAAVYGTVEQREREKHVSTAASQAARIAELEENLRIADESAASLQYDLGEEHNQCMHYRGAFEQAEKERRLAAHDLEDAEKECNELREQIERERAQHLETVTRLVEALGADENQKRAVLKNLENTTKRED